MRSSNAIRNYSRAVNRFFFLNEMLILDQKIKLI